MSGKDEKYREMLSLSRPHSKNHSPMSILERAAQFAPFAALNGHDDEINETARLTEARANYDENKAEEFDRVLNHLLQSIDKHPSVSLIYFCPDTRKAGGAYLHHSGELKKIDEYERMLVFADKTKVAIDMICEIAIK